MKSYKKILALLIFLILTITNTYNCAGEENSINENTVEESMFLELFVFSPCEACKEGQKFEDVLRNQFSASGLPGKKEYRSYNVFHEEERVFMEERLKELGKEVSLQDAPIAVVGEKAYFGSYAEIAEQIVTDFMNQDTNTNGSDQNDTESFEIDSQDVNQIAQQQSDLAGSTDNGNDAAQPGIEAAARTEILHQLEEVQEDETGMILFTTLSCVNCEAVEKWISENLPSEYGFPDGKTSQIRFFEQSIMESGGLDALDALNRIYHVSTEDQQVPIHFYKDGFFSGEKAICEGIQTLLNTGTAVGKWPEFPILTNQESTKQPLWRVFLTGLVNGLNPCGMSMLLMVLSLLLNTNSSFLSGSLSYLAGKFLAYMCMGTGVFYLFAVVESSGFHYLERGLTIAFAILALVIGLLNFVDYWNVRRKEYGKVIVQLPAALRRKNHQWINKLKEIPPVYILPFLFGLGMLISMGEFFCTGQLYAASVLQMARTQTTITIEVFLWLFTYVFAMCLPLLILILVIQKTRSIFAVSQFTLDGMPIVKLINGIFFLFLAWLLAFA